MSKILKPEKPVVLDDLEVMINLKISDVKIDDIEPLALKHGYRRQIEPHITVLSGRKIRLIRAENPEIDKLTLAKKLHSAIQKFDWQYKEKSVYHIERADIFTGGTEIEERKSYIREVEMPDMKRFYEEISKEFNVNLPVQFPHITLYTQGERKNPTWYGIPVPSENEFQNLKPIKIT